MRIMATRFGYKKDAIRVKAMKIDGDCMPDIRKFSVDPQITSYDVLQSILIKAFELKQNFSVYYRVLDDYNQETYLPLLSDWDLDAAFFSAAEPCLCLRIEMKVFEQLGEEWDATSASFSWITDSKIPLRLQGLIMNVEKTVSIVRGAFSFNEDVQQAQEVTNLPFRLPLTDAEFKKYLDPVGQLIKPEELKNAIYFGGVEPSFRKVVWKLILNVYPKGLSGQQRIEFIRRKSYEYEQLKNSWKNIRNNEKMMEDLDYVTSMVKKDVLRTDRQHYFYAGSDDNQNIVSLFNILTTYAINHPSVSYCQGMSDLASPLLVTMGNEAHAYICFCSLMRRLSPNFLIDGITMTQRFQHLAVGLMYYDPVFYSYLKNHQADDLLFCYRWLLLEMKREFAFEDALHMLEVMWSSLPPAEPPENLPLYEVRFCSNSQLLPPPSPSLRETPYTKVCALRRRTASNKMSMLNRSLDEPVIAKGRLHSSFREKTKKHNSLDDNTLYRNQYTNSVNSLNGFSKPTMTLSSLSSFSRTSSSSSDSDSCKSLSYQEKKSYSSELKKRYQSLLDNSSKNNSINKKDSFSVSNKIVKNFNEFLTLGKKISDKTEKETFLKSGNSNSSLSSDNNSSPDDLSEYYPMTTSITQKLSKDLENLEKRVFSLQSDGNCKSNNTNIKINGEEIFLWENPLQYEVTQEEIPVEIKGNEEKIIYENCKKQNYSDTPINNEFTQYDDLKFGNSAKCENKNILPGPTEFGGGNPFLMFLCITVLCQHRDIIIKSGMDYNEIAMHFDKMVRKHNVVKVLNQARLMYASYLKQHRVNYLKV